MIEIKEEEYFGGIIFTMLKDGKEIDKYDVDKTIFQDYFNKDVILEECLNDESFKKLRIRVKTLQRVTCLFNLFCRR